MLIKFPFVQFCVDQISYCRFQIITLIQDNDKGVDDLLVNVFGVVLEMTQMSFNSFFAWTRYNIAIRKTFSIMNRFRIERWWGSNNMGTIFNFWNLLEYLMMSVYELLCVFY